MLAPDKTTIKRERAGYLKHFIEISQHPRFSPLRLFLTVVLTVIIANLIGLLVQLHFPNLSIVDVFLLDVLLLVVFLFPLLYLFVFRPFLVNFDEKHRIEETLAESINKFRSFFENSLDGMLITTPEGLVQAANSAACATLGFSEEELKRYGRSAYIDLTNPVISESISRHCQAGKFQGELTFRKRDGSEFPAEVSSSLYKNGHGDAIIFTTFHDITKRKAERAELVESRSQLRKLMTYLHGVQEKERSVIAREIHDELGQVLATVQMGVSLLVEEYQDHHHLTRKISGFNQMLESAIKCVQRISSELRPLMLDTLGLAEAIEWQAKEFQKHSGIQCDLTIALEVDCFRDDVAITIFRIFQESLTNIIRHSGADYISVRLEEKNNRLVLIVRDNGKGITKEQRERNSSLGIMGIRERAFAVGGRARFLSEPGRGTTVIAHIPVHSPE